MIVESVRVDALGVAPFAGVRRVVSTNETVRRPTANGLCCTGPVVVVLAATGGAEVLGDDDEHAASNTTNPTTVARAPGFAMPTECPGSQQGATMSAPATEQMRKVETGNSVASGDSYEEAG